MNSYLINRFERLQRLRNFAISENNFFKKYQAERLIKQLTDKLNTLSHFSIN
jgi:hypothetical protein